MGTFTVPIQVGDLAGQNFVELDALVDTGSTYTVLSKDVLDRLGIDIREPRAFDLADDRVVEYPVGYASIRLANQEIIAMVVFADEGTTPLLGATALETASVAVDPVHQKLVPVHALLK